MRTVVESARVERRGADISRLMNVAVSGLEGRTLDDVDAAADKLFRKKIAGMIFPGARALVEAHAAKGHTIVIASSATPPQIVPRPTTWASRTSSPPSSPSTTRAS